MAVPCLSPDRSILPAQVWGRLAVDLQARVLRLMAQLAFNLVAAQSPAAPLEADHGGNADPTQNHSGPS